MVHQLVLVVCAYASQKKPFLIPYSFSPTNAKITNGGGVPSYSNSTDVFTYS